MVQNSLELVRNFFEGKSVARPPFFPWVCSFAAKLEQVPVRTMLSDPGLLSKALSNTHKLFGYDVILNHFDPFLEAEALGCEIEWQDDSWPSSTISHPLEGDLDFYDLDTENLENKSRLPVILEATKRLILTKGKEVPIAAMLTGPLTLANYLKGREFARQLEIEDGKASDLVEDTGTICVKLCRLYCELGVDIIVIAEDIQDLIIPDLSSVLVSPLKSIINVSRFYTVNSVLIGKVSNDNQVRSMCNLGADAVAVSGNINNDQIQNKAREGNYRYAITIPDSSFTQYEPEYIDKLKHVIKSGESGFFLSSEWELNRNTDVNNMHQIMGNIRGE